MSVNLKTMPRDLLQWAWLEERHVQPLRDEVRRRAVNGDRICMQWLELARRAWQTNGGAPASVTAPANGGGYPDISPITQAVVDDDPKALRLLYETLQRTDWDFIDPAGLMKKSPEEVHQFMRDHSMGWPKKYSTLTSGMQQFYIMICDAYMRAKRVHDTATRTD